MLAEQKAEHDQKLQQTAQGLVDAVHNHFFDRRHIAADPRHDVAGGLVVEPAHGQPLDLVIEFPAQVMHHRLLKGVVAEHPGGEEHLPERDGAHRESGRG